MIRIDSDTHFTPLDAFADLDPKYRDQGPRLVELPTPATVGSTTRRARRLCPRILNRFGSVGDPSPTSKSNRVSKPWLRMGSTFRC